MPIDKEMHLCVKGIENVFSLANALGITLIDSEDAPIETYKDWDKNFLDIDINSFNQYKNILKDAWLEAINEKGWSIESVRNNNFYMLDTEYGKREATPFQLILQYDRWEVGDAPEEVTLGINLSSRYFPCFLDMDDPHGALGSVVDIFNFVDDINIAKSKIIKHIPQFSDGAKPMLRDIFY